MKAKLIVAARLLLSAVCILATAMPALAREFKYTYEGQKMTYTVIDETAKTCMTKAGAGLNPGNKVSGELIIPEVASDGTNEYSVVSIGENAFYECSTLRSVTMPGSVTSIGDCAFQGCSGLTSVSFPNSLISIGESAFNNCSALTAAAIPNSVTSIGMNAFNGCNGMISVNIPSALTSIENSVFYGCTSLTSITIPGSVTSIAVNAFRGCKTLAYINIGNGVTSIGNYAFRECPATSVNITAQVPPAVNANAFSNFTGTLRVQDPGDNSILDAYSGATGCWNAFSSIEPLVVATSLSAGDSQPLDYEPGTTQQLHVTVEPEEASLKDIIWYSTNPEIATVDHAGLVNYHASEGDLEAAQSSGRIGAPADFKIVASTLYADGPVVEFAVDGITTGGIGTVTGGNNSTIDYTAPFEVYNLNGKRCRTDLHTLAPGIYIIRQGTVTTKIAVEK